MSDAAGQPSRRKRLLELAALFLRLGFTAFGGPAAHIAMMEDEVVARRQWLTREEFLDLLGATNLIPGPNSTEMAIHIGHRRAGWPGLIVAGTCFIVPAVLIVSAIAWGYVRFGTLPRSTAILDGVKPVVLAIVTQALWRLGRSLMKSWALGALAAAAVAASLLGVDELAILAGCGLVVGVARARRAPRLTTLFPLGGLAATGSAAATATVGLLPLFLVFLKIGSVLFGSGYVLLAFLRSDLVERYHWLTNSQLLDAVSIGQVTPGPVFTTATFIGWVLRGPVGALIATVGIFLPAFIFVAVSGPLVPRIRRSRVAGAVLDGVNVGSLALMATVTWQLGRTSIVSWWAIALAILSLAVLLSSKVSSMWLIGLGAIVGFAAHWLAAR
jgi:chromate transporter